MFHHFFSKVSGGDQTVIAKSSVKIIEIPKDGGCLFSSIGTGRALNASPKFKPTPAKIKEWGQPRG